tara:strand:+ start:8662 stop:10713 length:2052 start_codon:yes stop_codon:yes gene_type:complete
VADPINPQLTGILEQLTLMRENLDAIFLGEQTDKKDKKKTTKDLVKVRIDDIKDVALEKLADALNGTGGKKREKESKEEDKSGGLLKQVGGAIGDFVGTAFGTAAKAGGPYAALLALGIGGGIALTALGIAGAIKIIAPALPQIYEFIKNALPEFSKFIKDLLPAFAQFINDILGGEGFLKFIHTITDFYINVLKHILDALPNIIKGVGIAIQSVLAGIGDIMKQIPAIVKAIAGGVSEILKPITQMIQQIISDFIKTIPSLLAQIPPILATIKPFFDTLIEFAKTTIHEIIDFAKYLIDNLPIIKEFLAPIIDLIKDLASKWLQYLTIGITALKDALIILIDKGLNPLILGLRDALISLFENLQKIIESLATIIITLGNNIENILTQAFHGLQKIIQSVADVIISLSTTIQNIVVPVIQLFDRAISGVIGTIKLLIDKGFTLMENALSTIQTVLKDITNFFETMPGKISTFIQSVVQSVKDLASVSATDLGLVAGGITAVALALAALGGGGLVKGFLSLFSADPVKQLQRFVELKDGLTETANAIKLLAESLKALGADGLGKAIGTNLKEVANAINQLPVETIKVATSVTQTSKTTPAVGGAPTNTPKEDVVAVLKSIKGSIDNQVNAAVSANTLLSSIAKLISEADTRDNNNIVLNQPRNTTFTPGEGSRASAFRTTVATT